MIGRFRVAEHGMRARYVQWCRCPPCTGANRDYARARYLAVCQGRADPLVSTARSRRHLRKLQRAEIGTRTVSDLSGCSRSILQGIRDGSRKRCRKSTQDRILGVPSRNWNDSLLVEGAPSWVLLGELIALGYTRGALARELGSTAKIPSLQLGKVTVTARNRRKVERLYRRLRWAQR